jgi:hypothetical protein
VQSSLQDSQGRTVVTIHDDRGEPYSNVFDAVDILGSQAFTDVVSLPLTPDASLPRPRPALVKGQIVIAAQISFTVGAIVYVLADVRVLGFCGSTAMTIAATEIGGGRPLMRVQFTEGDTFDRIVVQARFVVNGTPSSDPTGVQQCKVSAVVDMYTP